MQLKVIATGKLQLCLILKKVQAEASTQGQKQC